MAEKRGEIKNLISPFLLAHYYSRWVSWYTIPETAKSCKG